MNSRYIRLSKHSKKYNNIYQVNSGVAGIFKMVHDIA